METAVRESAQRSERAVAALDKRTATLTRTLSGATTFASSFGLAVSAAASGAEQNFVSLAGTVLASFAIGGPVIGGLTAVAAAVGFFVGQTEEATEAQKQLAAAEKVLTDQRERLLGIEREIALFRQLGREPTQAEKDAARIEAEIADANLRRGFAIIQGSREQQAEAQKLFEAISEQLDVQERIIATERERAALIADQAREAAALAAAQQEFESRMSTIGAQRVAVERQLATFGKSQAEQLIDQRTALEASIASQHRVVDAALRREDAEEGITEEQRRQASQAIAQLQLDERRLQLVQKMLDAIPSKPRAVTLTEQFLSRDREAEAVAFAARASSITQASLSDAITDGVFTGFENADEILERFGQAITATIIDAFIEASIGESSRAAFLRIGQLIAGAPSGGGGADAGASSLDLPQFQFGGLVTRPTVARLAEREPELVMRPRDIARMLHGVGGGSRGPIHVTLLVKPEPITQLGLTKDVRDRYIRADVRSPETVVEYRGG